MKFVILFGILSLLSAASGYRILLVFPVPSKSHNNLGRGLAGALLKAGHEVTYATPFPDKKTEKGLTFIEVKESLALLTTVDPLLVKDWDISKLNEFGLNISLAAASNPELRSALVRQQFDAVITEKFFSDLQAGFAAVQQVPWIVLSGTVMHPSVELLVDDIRSAGIIPNIMSDYSIPMTLWQRMANTYVTVMMAVGAWLEIAPSEVHYNRVFGPMAKERGVVLPPFSEAMYNISILLVNSHPSLAPAQSLPPNVVDIAGYHIEEHHAPLPKDLQDLLDKSTQGVIYFSMGSVVKASSLPLQTRKDLIRILGELPYTVLWKFEEALEGLPKNVHVRAWMPQPAILAHPNTRLFITHGGLLSTLEALQAGVPLLAVPVFGDQPGNARRAALAGYAVTVPYAHDMGDSLREALKEMLRNDSYYNKAKFLSRIFNNRPVPASKLLAHYVELAIETQGAYHLRSTSRLYKWYERYMLDQLAVVLVALCLIIMFVKTGIQMALKSITGKPGKQKKH